MRLLVVMAVVAVVTATDQVANPSYQFPKTPGANLMYYPVIPSYPNAYYQPTFLTHPMYGFGTHYVQKPVATAAGRVSAPAIVPVVPQQYTSRSEQGLPSPVLSPLLKLAVDAGFVRASGSSQTGSLLYKVSNDLAEDAGSVSELAYRLNANTVAAVHDVQMRPDTTVPAESFSPVLNHKDTPKATLYTLEVPVQ